MVFETINEELKETNEESDVPTKSEVELFNKLVGGFFYSESDDQEYESARREAIKLYKKKVIEVLEQCFELQENLEFYEN